MAISPAGHPCSSCHTSTSTNFCRRSSQAYGFPRSFRICITALLAAYHRCCLACLFSLAVHRPSGRPITVFVYRCYSLASALSLTQLSLSDSFLSLNTRWLGCKDALGCVEGRRGGLVFFSDPTQSCNTSATFRILVFTATFCFLHRLARGMDLPGRLSELGYIGVFIVGWENVENTPNLSIFGLNTQLAAIYPSMTPPTIAISNRENNYIMRHRNAYPSQFPLSANKVS